MDDLFNFKDKDFFEKPKNVPTKQAGFGQTNTGSDSSDSNLQQSQAPTEDKNKVKTYKVIVVGDAQCGKSSFLTKHLNGSFDASYRATIGSSAFNLEFNTNLDTHKFEVLDIAGQNLFAGKRDQYYKGIDGAIVMYDVMNWASYDNITDVWLKELRVNAPSGIPIVIVGNKMEHDKNRAVSVEVVAEAIQQEWEPRRIDYCEISVKTNQNLADPFLKLTKRFLNINDSKALYFVSKISELNLIESMLAQKQSKAAAHAPTSSNQSTESSSQNLENLFAGAGAKNMAATDASNGNGNIDKNNNNKGGDYLDNVLFQFGGDDDGGASSTNKHASNKSDKNNDTDDTYLSSMMTNNNNNRSRSTSNPPTSQPSGGSAKPSGVSATPNLRSRNPFTARASTTTISKTPKAQSISPRVVLPPSRLPPQSAATTTQMPAHPTKLQKARSDHSVKISANAALRKVNTGNTGNADNSGVVIDLLLGIQETLNHLNREMRRLQTDVAFLKQEHQKQNNRVQRR
eukprot:CAMPEP_0202698708 /NCGR_PEP_ID=MMETSP1385-20130828/11946_1 /ASSEMBLY_ACC=CAM_ASM_000861 /TAXON_ID=933848 /ORGANISM="Elphidium margaritaceum" /LENGTH=513 /DNA_ID=CAMNT_0049355475 /DNA_START=50 /DNA_END=1591 /DNA_ORIENTATION=+